MPAGETEVVALMPPCHLSLTGLLPALKWQEFTGTQKSLGALCFYLHKVGNDCELDSVPWISGAQC